MLRLPPLPPAIQSLTDPDSQRLDALHNRTLPRTLSECVTCRGKKMFLWRDPQGQPAQYECPCADQRILNRFLLYCNIPLTYQQYSWVDATNVEAGAMTEVIDYAAMSEPYLAAGIGLILHGTGGTGKTLVATLLLKQLISKGQKGYFCTFNELLSSFTAGWRDPEDKKFFISNIKNSPFLVLDDVGKEMKGRSDLTEALMDEVLRHRVASLKPTILTTNYNFETLKAGYGTGVMSLLSERSISYEFTSQDFRPQVQQRVLYEARNGLTRPVVLA